MSDRESANQDGAPAGHVPASDVSHHRQLEWGDSPGETAQDPPAASPMSLALAWQGVYQWWLVALPSGILLAGALIALVWVTFEPVYVAEALLKIESDNAYVFFAEGAGRVGTDRFEQTQVELIRSSVVLGRVIEQPEIASLPEILTMDNPASTLSEKLYVGSQNESDLYNVRFESTNPESAAAIVNTVVTQYVQIQDDEASTRNGRVIELVEAEVRKRDEDLQQLRAEVRSLERAMPEAAASLAADGSQNARASLSPVVAWSAQHTTSIAEREVLIATATAYEEAMASGQVSVPPYVIDEAVEQSPEIEELRRLLAVARLKLGEAKSVSAHPESDRNIQLYERQISSYEDRMKELRLELRPQLALRLQQQFARTEQNRLAAEVARMKADIKVRETVEALLTEKIQQQRQADGVQGDGEPVDEQLAKLQYARVDLERAEQVYQNLLERADMLKTESRLPSRVSVLQPAEVPSSPVEVFPLSKMATAGAMGLALPFLLAFLWEFRVQRVVASKQISHGSVLPLLAEVPRLPSRPILAKLRSSNHFDSQCGMLQDSVHYLCRNLLLSEKARDLQTLAVTSAVSSEGKTTLASQLAVSLALYSHQRVLLIDADMRCPSIHEVFNVPVSPGLAELLADSGSPGAALEAIVSNGRSHLVSVLPSGKLEEHPHVILGAGRFETLLDSLRQSYRYIVVDTPPVVAAGEALSLCKSVDGTLLSVMQDRSRQKEVLLAYQRLIAVGANPVGVVLSGVSGRYYSSRYGYYGRASHE